jgi:hypothetical protein
MKKCVLIIISCFSFSTIYAQLALPDFQVTELTESKVRVYWKNSFSNCTQITIQKSYDSLKYFRTIFSSLSPELPENAFVDNDYLPELKNYYRILYVTDDGNYAFTVSKRPVMPKNAVSHNILIQTKDPIKLNRLITINEPYVSKKDSSNIKRSDVDSVSIEPNYDIKPKIHLLDSIKVSALPQKKIYLIYYRQVDSLYKILDEPSLNKFKDSIINKTKDTLYAYENDIFVWKKFIPDPIWQPSEYIYTATKGYVVIQTPLYKKHKYKLIIYDDENKEVLRIKHVKSDYLMLEKSNFIKAGWYYFELFEDEKLKEKNKFQLVADF